MDERIMQFRVGVMVLATLIITAILVLLFGKVPSLVPHATYTIYVRFPEAPGVTRDTPVRKSGILIGRVSDIRFDKDDTRRARDRRDRRRPQGLSQRGLPHRQLADRHRRRHRAGVRARRPTAKDRARPSTSGETIEGMVAADPSRAIGNLEQSLAKRWAVSAAPAMTWARPSVASTRCWSTNEERITRVIAEADETLKILKIDARPTPTTSSATRRRASNSRTPSPSFPSAQGHRDTVKQHGRRHGHGRRRT